MILSSMQQIKLQNRGRVHWIDKNSRSVYKIYNKVNLLDDANNIELRLNQIVKLTSIMDFMPQTNYLYEEDMLVMSQEQLIKQKKLKQINPKKRLVLIEEFSCSLDKIYNEGFIHGDINRKNIYNTRPFIT